MITLGSLFDGIGGWQLAAVKNGVKPLWSSEIDPFPASITKKHFPDTIQLGDVTKTNGAEIPPVDIICAGSPCQDLSIAGRREGLDGKRSGLFYHAMRIVREMREKTNGVYPKFFVWENVTGAFSSNRGRDFQSVLEEIGQTDIPMPASGRWARAGMAGMSRNGPICKEKTAFTLTSVDRYCTLGDVYITSHSSDHATKVNSTAFTLSSCDYKMPQSVLTREAFVRRLTPLECERLQGLPDNWTAYGSDYKRYKVIGNGMAQPCADFVIEKLVEVLKERG